MHPRKVMKTTHGRRSSTLCTFFTKKRRIGRNSDKPWQTAALLFSEYICLAIMSFPYSYSVLGLVPGLIVTVVVAFSVLYTSLIVW